MWTLEKFRIPLGGMLLLGEVFVIEFLVEILDCHWESRRARCLGPGSYNKMRRSSSANEAEEKDAMETNELRY